jgi:hypothetical protein
MSPCAQSQSPLARILGMTPKEKHILKVQRLEYLGGRTHYGRSPAEMMTVYRYAVHFKCVVCGQDRITEETRLTKSEEAE